MVNSYSIRAKNKDTGEWTYYCIDKMSGYPCWVSFFSMAKKFSNNEFYGAAEEIKTQISKNSSYFINNDIDSGTIEIIELGVVKSYNVNGISDKDIVWHSIKSKLTPKELEFINSEKGVKNGE